MHARRMLRLCLLYGAYKLLGEPAAACSCSRTDATSRSPHRPISTVSSEPSETRDATSAAGTGAGCHRSTLTRGGGGANAREANSATSALSAARAGNAPAASQAAAPEAPSLPSPSLSWQLLPVRSPPAISWQGCSSLEQLATPLPWRLLPAVIATSALLAEAAASVASMSVGTLMPRALVSEAAEAAHVLTSSLSAPRGLPCSLDGGWSPDLAKLTSSGLPAAPRIPSPTPLTPGVAEPIDPASPQPPLSTPVIVAPLAKDAVNPDPAVAAGTAAAVATPAGALARRSWCCRMLSSVASKPASSCPSLSFTIS
eukprot:1166555-Pleurochrysis_carterae.AAC.3